MTGARQTHFRYDQNLNSVPRTMPARSAAFPATRPVSPSVCVVNPRQASWMSKPTPARPKNASVSRRTSVRTR